jgi:hypothetical protein
VTVGRQLHVLAGRPRPLAAALLRLDPQSRGAAPLASRHALALVPSRTGSASPGSLRRGEPLPGCAGRHPCTRGLAGRAGPRCRAVPRCRQLPARVPRGVLAPQRPVPRSRRAVPQTPRCAQALVPSRNGEAIPIPLRRGEPLLSCAGWPARSRRLGGLAGRRCRPMPRGRQPRASAPCSAGEMRPPPGFHALAAGRSPPKWAGQQARASFPLYWPVLVAEEKPRVLVGRGATAAGRSPP